MNNHRTSAQQHFVEFRLLGPFTLPTRANQLSSSLLMATLASKRIRLQTNASGRITYGVRDKTVCLRCLHHPMEANITTESEYAALIFVVDGTADPVEQGRYIRERFANMTEAQYTRYRVILFYTHPIISEPEIPVEIKSAFPKKTRLEIKHFSGSDRDYLDLQKTMIYSGAFAYQLIPYVSEGSSPTEKDFREMHQVATQLTEHYFTPGQSTLHARAEPTKKSFMFLVDCTQDATMQAQQVRQILEGNGNIIQKVRIMFFNVSDETKRSFDMIQFSKLKTEFLAKHPSVDYEGHIKSSAIKESDIQSYQRKRYEVHSSYSATVADEKTFYM